MSEARCPFRKIMIDQKILKNSCCLKISQRTHQILQMWQKLDVFSGLVELLSLQMVLEFVFLHLSLLNKAGLKMN